MKITTKNKVLIMIVTILQAQAEGLALEYTGNLRLGMQYHDNDKSANDFAIGANVHAEGRLYDGIGAVATFYTTQALFNQNGSEGVSFFNSRARSYSILSEAYIKGAFGNTTATFGRQILDTPFLDSDDIGMVPNSFEAYTLFNRDIQDTTLVYAYVRSMSGVDAQRTERFNKINGGSGLHIVGATYEGVKDLSLAAWFYKMASRDMYSYVEATCTGKYTAFDYALGAQVAWQQFKEREDAKTLGAYVSLLHHDSALTARLAYNRSYGGVADNGFGGGPFFTSSENMTLADHSVHGDVFFYGLAWDASDALTLSLSQARLHDASRHNGYEVDVVAHVNYHDSLSFDAIYSKIDNTNVSGDKFDNVRVFANYSF